MTVLLADGHLQLGEDDSTIELAAASGSAKPEDLGVAYMLGMALLHDSGLTKARRCSTRF